MVTKTINGTTYDSDTSFAGYSYVPNILALAGDIMVEADARSGAVAQFTFSTTTTDADPGAGLLRLNQATQNTATQIFVDLADADGADVTAMLDALDDSTSATKGWLMLRQRNDKTKWLLFRLTAVTSASGYRKLTVVLIASSTASPFADGAPLLMGFARTGDKGDTGTLSLTVGTLTGSIDADGYNITDVGNLTAAAATVTDLTATEATVSTLLTVAAGMQSGVLYLGDVSGEVVIEASDPLHIYCTIVGDTTFLVAGGTVPGTSHDHLIHWTMGGAGGYAVTVRPVNELTYSADLQSTAEAGESRPWTDTNTSLDDNAAVGPDGQTTLTKLIEDADGADAFHSRLQNLTGVSPNQTLTGLVVCKDAGNSRNLLIEIGDVAASGNYIYVVVNPADGSVVLGPANVGTATGAAVTVTAIANSNFLVALTGHPNTSGSDAFIRLSLTAAGTDNFYIGNGTSGLYIGEAQVNKGSPVGIGHVGATRAGQVYWQGVPTDFPAIAAAEFGDLAISIEPDGRIVLQDHTVEEL